MRYLFIIVFLFNTLYGWENESTGTNSDDTIVVQVPTQIERDPDIMDLSQAFICPKIENRLINKTTNIVEKKWINDIYDHIQIFNVDLQKGSYSCKYYTDEQVGEVFHFTTNDYYREILKSYSSKIKNGTLKVLGYDFNVIQDSVSNLDKSDFLDVHKIIDDVGLNIDFDKKKYGTMSQMYADIFTINDNIIGTNAQGDLIINQQYQTYTSDGFQPIEATNQEAFFGDDYEVTWFDKVKRYVGFDTPNEAAKENRNEMLFQIDSLNSYINKSQYGHYFNMFVSGSILSLTGILVLIIIIKLFFKVSLTEMQSKLLEFEKKAKTNNITKLEMISGLSVFSFIVLFFILTVDFTVNGEKKDTDISFVHKIFALSVNGYGIPIADEIIYNTTQTDLKYYANRLDIYSKPQLQMSVDEIAAALTIINSQSELLEVCRNQYEVYSNSFVLDDNEIYIRPDYPRKDIFSKGTCRNFEEGLYFNLKSVHDTSVMLENKISSVSSNGGMSQVEKSLAAITHNTALATKNMGLLALGITYNLPKYFDQISVEIENSRQEDIQKAQDSYFSKSNYFGKEDDNWFVDNGSALMSVLTSTGLMHTLDMFTNIQQTIFRFLRDDNSIINGTYESSSLSDRNKKESKSKKKNFQRTLKSKFVKFVKTISNSNVAIKASLSFLDKSFSVVSRASDHVISYLVAQVLVLDILSSLKNAAVTVMILIAIFIYFIHIAITLKFIFFYAVRYLKNLLTENEKSETLIHLTDRIIYFVAYPTILVFSVKFLMIFEESLMSVLQIYIGMEIQNMKLVSYIVSSNSSYFESMSTNIEAVYRIGMIGGIYSLLSYIAAFFIAWYMLFKMPKFILSMIGRNIIPDDFDDAMNKADNKIDKTQRT